MDPADLEGSGLPYMPEDIAILKNCLNYPDTNFSLHPEKTKPTTELNSNELKTANKKDQNFNGSQCSNIYDNDNSWSESSSPPPLSSDFNQERQSLPPLKTVRLDNDKMEVMVPSKNRSHSSASSTSSHEKMKHMSTISDREWFEGQRFNPFNTEVVFQEDHYSEVGSTSSSDSHAWSFIHDNSIPTKDTLDISFAELGLAEDHFSHPEGHFGQTSEEELLMAIENCKELIRQCDASVATGAERQQKLVRKIIQLRMYYQELKEGPVQADPEIKVVMSHHFKMRVGATKHPCEKCKGVIWGMIGIHPWYKCQDCGYHCHQKCLNTVTRICPSAKISQGVCFITDICPEKGLSRQKFRCADCREPIEYQSNQGWQEPRQCDYTGNFYCEMCHWEDQMIIPARVLYNWDFEPRKVCRASRQFLKLLMKKPVLDIEAYCPLIFKMSDMTEIQKLRNDILLMKKYFIQCKKARDNKLLLSLEGRQHFVENSCMYSLRDLIDANLQSLLPELREIVRNFLNHIKNDCTLCRAKGFTCEICQSPEILFPFDVYTSSCTSCSQVFHRKCFMKMPTCPRCTRRARRGHMQE